MVMATLLVSKSVNGQQGNYKYNNYGNRSILLTGNVTGSVSDIGLTYYNPAKLTSIEINGVAFNARAYQFRSLKVDPVFEGASPLKDIAFNGVPSIVGGTFNLFNERFAYVYLSKYRVSNSISTNYDELNANITTTYPDAESLSLSLDINNAIRDYWYGLSWAKKINSEFSLGVSLFASYYSYRGSREIDRILQYDINRVSTDLLRYSFQQRSIGLNVKLGASYVINNVELGMNISFPQLEFYGSGNFKIKSIDSGTPNGEDAFYDYNLDPSEATRKLPFGVSIGAGIEINRSRIHINIDYMNHLDEYERLSLPAVDLGDENPTPIVFNERRNSVVNFGVGGELYISETVKTYFGISTDFDSYDNDNDFFDFNTSNADEFGAGSDFVHFSCGIDWKLSWANIIFGLTYARGTSDVKINSDFFGSDVFLDPVANSTVLSQRLQFVLGFEIPFLNKGMKRIKERANIQ